MPRSRRRLTRCDASAAAGFDEGEQDGAALSGLRLADEQPVLFADGGGADGVLHGVVVDLNATVFEIDEQQGHADVRAGNGQVQGDPQGFAGELEGEQEG